MHTSGLFAAATLLLSTVSAQRQYSINPDSVPISTRRSWCVTQRSSCPLLCLQNKGNSATTAANDCDADTLSYSCVCGNGLTPNLTEYSETLPYFICTEYGNQCVSSCGGNTDCQYNCRALNPCGATNPTRVNLTTTSSAVAEATGSADPSKVQNGFGGVETEASSSSNGGTTKKSGSAMAMDLGKSYGLAVIAAGVFAGFAMVL